MLGAALITASAAHGLLCLATLPGLIDAPSEGFIGGAVKVLGTLWTIAGVLAGGYVALQTLSVFNGKDYAKARLAAIGTLGLPVVGLVGGVTAFALVPIGAAAWWLLRQPSWQAGFAEFQWSSAVENVPQGEVEAELVEQDAEFDANPAAAESEVEEPALR